MKELKIEVLENLTYIKYRDIEELLNAIIGGHRIVNLWIYSVESDGDLMEAVFEDCAEMKVPGKERYWLKMTDKGEVSTDYPLTFIDRHLIQEWLVSKGLHPMIRNNQFLNRRGEKNE